MLKASYYAKGDGVNDDTAASVSIEAAESYYSSWSAYYPVVVQETRDGVTKQLLSSEFPARGEGIFMGALHRL